jgi:hypothetical protein
VSNTNDYIITTLSSGSQEYTNLSDNPIQAPFSLGAPNARTIRLTGAPYVSTVGQPSNIFTRQVISPDSGVSYISPFLYMDFETSSSTVVDGNQGTYSSLTGTLEKGTGTGDLAPRYVTSSPYEGTYSLEFYDNSNSITETNALNFGTPNENPEWSMITGSFSFALWYYPYSLSNSFGFNSLFNHKTLTVGSYEWLIVLGDNTGSGDGPIGFYDPGQSPFWFKYEPQTGAAAIQPNQWNHIVVTVSGTVADDNRKFRAYINGTDLGILGKQDFPAEYDASKEIFFGQWQWNSSAYELNGKIDEVSFWDFDLNPGQASALWNEGNGANAMTALTQSS